MKRIWITAALTALALATSSSVAQADQTLRFNIVGAGHVTGDGLDCTRATADGPLIGDCAELVADGPIECDEQFCFPTLGSLTFQAQAAGGFHFTSWSHPQCQGARNPCSVLVALGIGNPDLSVTATFADVQPPIVMLTSPANGAAVHGAIPLSATASDNARVANLVFRVGGNPFQTFEVAPFTTTLDTRTRPDGPVAISATATDGAGLANVSTANVIVDNTNPALTLTGPADGSVFRVGQRAGWTIAASDATTGPPALQCSVVTQGQPPVFGACTSPTTESLANPRAGRFTLTVRATDRAGNPAQQTRSFTVGGRPVPCELNGRPIICP